MGEEGVEEGGGEVLEVGEGVAAVGDDVVAEGADVDGGVGGHVEGVEKLIFRGEEREIRGGGAAAEELVLKVGGGDGVGEERVAEVAERLQHVVEFEGVGGGIFGVGGGGGGGEEEEEGEEEGGGVGRWWRGKRHRGGGCRERKQVGSG